MQGGALDEIIPKPIPLPNPEPHPRSNRRSLRKLRTAVVECRRQRLKRRRRRSRVVELHRSIHAVSRASGEPWHRAKAAMLVADCASEALTTEDELRRERSGVQCEAQATRPASLLSDENCHLLLHVCCSRAVAFAAAELYSLLRVPGTCACSLDPQVGPLGW